MNENLWVLATAEDATVVRRNSHAVNRVVVFGPHLMAFDGRVPSFGTLTEGPQSNGFVSATRHQKLPIVREFHCVDKVGVTHTIAALKQLRLLFGFGGTVGSKWRNATAGGRLQKVASNWFSQFGIGRRSFFLLLFRYANGFLDVNKKTRKYPSLCWLSLNLWKWINSPQLSLPLSFLLLLGRWKWSWQIPRPWPLPVSCLPSTASNSSA